MSHLILTLLEQVQEDPWRKAKIFSEDMSVANESLFAAQDDSSRSQILSAWLSANQPCLFGKAAAKLGLISYCFLTEEDVQKGDEHLQAKIQKERLAWTNAGHKGEKSAFIILLISKRLAYAEPGPIIKQIAGLLCAHYLLLEEPSYDEILNDDIWLTMPSRDDAVWVWHCGVNFFTAQADGRWWQDHRIPGGMGFSTNSVGHLVKSTQLKMASEEMEKRLDAAGEEWKTSNIKSLSEALTLAMLTIDNASAANSGKATSLKAKSEEEERCPFSLPAKLKDKDPCSYTGFYHTDITVPSEYFVPSEERPASTLPIDLDFTYLFNDSLANPSHTTLAKGRRIRSSKTDHSISSDSSHKALRLAGRIVKRSTQTRLNEALSRSTSD